MISIDYLESPQRKIGRMLLGQQQVSKNSQTGWRRLCDARIDRSCPGQDDVAALRMAARTRFAFLLDWG
jgi:hypothetical protein